MPNNVFTRHESTSKPAKERAIAQSLAFLFGGEYISIAAAINVEDNSIALVVVRVVRVADDVAGAIVGADFFPNIVRFHRANIDV